MGSLLVGVILSRIFPKRSKRNFENFDLRNRIGCKLASVGHMKLIKKIMEAAKEMVHCQDIPMKLLVEEKITTLYVQNKTAQHVLENKTLEESLSR